jgi:hypothetical protein
MNAESFFRNLYRNCQGWVGIFDSRTKATSYFSLENLSAAAERAQIVSEGGGDAYMNVCTRTHDLGPDSRGGESDVPSVQTLWADIDYGTLGHKSTSCPPTVQDAYSLFADLPRPSLVVNSGGGLHCYWFLAHPLETAHGKEINRALQTHIANVAQSRGWHADAKCFNPAWMLRVPGTFNYKGGDRRVVSIVSAPLTRYTPDRFGPIAHVTALPKSRAASQPTAEALEARPTKTATEARQALREWLKKSKKAWAKAVLKGESFAEPGERDISINEVCATVAFVDPDTDAEELVEVLRASLETMAEEAPCDRDPVDNAVEKLTRHQVTARKERAETEQWNKETRERQAKQARAAAEQRIAHEAPGAPAESPGGIYTDAEILQYAQSQRCSVEEFRRRWIIQKADTFYVFVSGRYMPPIMRTELEVSLPRDLAPAPIEWSVPTQSGNGMRPKKIAEILRDHCTVARLAQANMTVDNSYYDEKTQTFVEAACRKRAIVPREDKQVQEWLTLLGGDQSERLLDWVATFTDLSRQTCALYIVGRPGDGKTMFAEGLARIYTTGAPTELESVLSNFNEALLDCPLIFGDEKIPSMIGDSGDLRQIIGKNSRKLKRKHKAEADLVGAVRLILAANNDTLLTFEEDLSAWDQQAVAQRFLYITPSPKCREYLINLGGRVGTDDWVSGDRIAAHALWLKDNRKVEPGERFLVQASSAALSRMLATQGKWPGLVCEWICKHINHPSPQVHNSAIRVGDGQVVVNATAVTDLWSMYIKGNSSPSSALVGRTLSKLSTGKAQIGSQRYHVMDVETVLEWAARNQVGDVEAMQRKIQAPVVERTGNVISLAQK